MAAENQIAKELMSIISSFLYRRYVQCISSRDAVTPEDFAKKQLSQEYWIDQRRRYRGKLINSDYLFEHFGLFSSEDGWTVRKQMVGLVKHESNLYESVGRVVLNMRGCGIDDWLEELEDPNNPPDELMLYCLSRTYNRHTLVICKSRNWSTIECDSPLTEEELLVSCHVHLVYLGNNVYAQLRRKPYSQDLSNPFTKEQLNQALMKVRGIGRPRSRPLDLSIPKETSATTSETEQSIGATHELTEKDREYLDTVIKNICPPSSKLDSTGDQSDGSYLFTLFVNPNSEDQTTPSVNIQGHNVSDDVNHDHDYCHEPTNTEASASMLENERVNASEPTTNMKGQNTQPDPKIIKGHNEQNAVTPVDSTDSDDEPTDEPTVENDTSGATTIINDMWLKHAQKDLGYVPLNHLTRLDILDLTRTPPDWDNMDPYSSLEDVSDSDNSETKNDNTNTSDENPDTSDTTEKVIGTMYYMRDRIPKRECHSDRPMRSTRSKINYAQFNVNDDEVSPTRPIKKPKVSSGPSADRMAAQRIIKSTPGTSMGNQSPEEDRVQKRFVTKNPKNTKPNRRNKQPKTEPVPVAAQPTDDDLDLGPGPMPEPKPKGTFATTEHKLVKHKPIRYFKCPVCGMHKSSVLKFERSF